MSAETEKYCTVLIHYEKGSAPLSDDLAKKLENKKDSVKAEGLEELILHMLNGESYPKLLMSVIRFVVTSNDHRVKKLLMIYWEIVDKCKENGELKEEMILVCNAIRNDLVHANEYVRGSTLRLLCKMKYYRIIEPLKEVVLRNLSHRHSYVRRNAVMCVYSIIKFFGVEVMPEAPEEIEQMLLVEGDLSTKRNAFLMLLNCDQDRAIKYVMSMQDQVSTMGDLFQLAVLELVRKACRTSPEHRGRCLRIVFSLTASTSTAVSYDCASTLVSLSSSPVAIHQATSAFVTLLTEQSDNNGKLIGLDRLQGVQKKHRQSMEGSGMDIFRALGAPSLDVRKKVLDICLGSLVSPRNVKDVVNLLKKELVKTLGYEAQSTEGNLEYRRLLIRALHACTAQFVDQAQGVMMMLMDFLSESDATTAPEVVMYLRELVASHAELRGPILQRLADTLGDMQQSRVLRGCLWLLGEYCDDLDLISGVINSIVTALRPLPMEVAEESTTGGAKDTGDKSSDKEKKAAGKYTTQTVVLADGTYGTKTVYEPAEGEQEVVQKDVKSAPVRNLLIGGDQLLAAAISGALTRLCLRQQEMPKVTQNEVLLVLANLFKIAGRRQGTSERSDSAVRIAQCIRSMVAASGGQGLMKAEQAASVQLTNGEWSSGSGRQQLGKVLEIATVNSEWTLGSGAVDDVEEKSVAPDETIVFRQLRERKGATGITDVIDEDDLAGARGSMVGQAAADGLLFAERLAKSKQMTGLADPVYVEAFLQVHSFDLVLELLVVNRTQEMLQNVLVELSTQGDLKIVDRPIAVTLEPGQQATVHASIKVGSTETGVIFGYVTHEKKSAADKECTVMNELHVDILDYIECASIGELAFHTMWSEFEWENKININTAITEVNTFLGHIMRNTNMSIVGRNVGKKATVVDKKAARKKKSKITEEDVEEMIRETEGVRELIESSSFVAVNLYAKSIFGEDALANVSIEKLPDGKLTGSVRIRSRTQGIALSLGDRVTVVQRGVGPSSKTR
jgi:coatomer subunit beta